MTKHCKSCRRDLDEGKYSEGLKTCAECLVNRKKKTKITLKCCQETAKSRSGKCLSTEYKTAHTKMKWECSDGHQWETSFSSIKYNNTWCPQCAGNITLTLEDCQEVAKSRCGKCLSTEYINNQIKMKWECSAGHQWKTSVSHIKNGTWCPQCAGNITLTLEYVKSFVENKGGKCISEKYVNSKTKMLFECEKGHQWETVWDALKSGCWCLECGGRKRLTIKECQEFAKNKGGKCLSDYYKNAYQKLLWECSNGHQWETNFHHIKHSKRWCPTCSGSQSERKCREIIEKYLLEPFPTKKPKWLEGLELDGYNKELNIAFEYNGKQHYKYIPHFHRNGEDDFEKQKERDRKKYRICREKKINLIIIPYQYDYTTPDELEDFIYTELCKIT